MQRWKTSVMSSLRRLLRDEHGGEVIEYALILGLIIVVAIGVITTVGGKVVARWQSVDSSM
jgi:Flp pilus assembly pilin Flp